MRQKEEVVEQALGKCICHILKKQGFGSANGRALKLLENAVLRYMVYVGAVVKRQCESARRSAPTLVDAVTVMKSITEILPNKERIQLETEEYVPFKEYVGKVCAYADYPQNYYEFLPRFPPAHTFKSTAIRRKVLDDKANKARVRNEQKMKIVDSLFGIVKRRNLKLCCANYLDN